MNCLHPEPLPRTDAIQMGTEAGRRLPAIFSLLFFRTEVRNVLRESHRGDSRISTSALGSQSARSTPPDLAVPTGGGVIPPATGGNGSLSAAKAGAVPVAANATGLFYEASHLLNTADPQ
jgi:hypothetical protein